MVLPQSTSGRRWLLINGSAAAAAGLALAGELVNSHFAAPQSLPPSSTAGFQTFIAATLQSDIAALNLAPGNNKLVNLPTFTVALTVERKKAAKEFEWHEARDHVFQIIDGSTVIEVGGTPKNAHSTGAGEWNAPESENAVTVSLNKGDILVIPRGTPHRRTTTGSVTLMLISPQGTVA
jgi:mannose-6-phosphate isomerase-like protein (cupin superfamily)